jgi:hypothetical protein
LREGLNLAGDQLEEVKEEKEKNEKRKIRIISQIDDLLAVQGQSYMKGKLKDVLLDAEEIIALATPENLQSFIREQEELIARVKGIQKQREEKERARLKAEEEKVKRDKTAKLKIKLIDLESRYNEAFSLDDLLQVSEIIEQSKTILSQLDDEKIKKKWEELAKKYIDTKVRKQLVIDADGLIIESEELIAKFEFEDVKLRIKNLIRKLKDKGIADYLKKLKDLQAKVLIAEKSYIKTRVKVEDLVQKTKLLQDNKRFEEAITNCETLLQLASSIDLRDRIEEFSKILPQLQKNLEFETLAISIKKLNKEGLELLKSGDLINSIEKFKLIKEALSNYNN